METPSSAQSSRLTRSQARGAAAAGRPPLSPAVVVSQGRTRNNKLVEFANDMLSTPTRKALSDVTNDSPIAGLVPALRSKKKQSTPYPKKINPSSSPSPSSARSPPPDGGEAEEEEEEHKDGEDVLRAQVKLLLAKVEKEMRVKKKAPSLRALSHINGFLSSSSNYSLPASAPTPWNSPSDLVILNPAGPNSPPYAVPLSALDSAPPSPDTPAITLAPPPPRYPVPFRADDGTNGPEILPIQLLTPGFPSSNRQHPDVVHQILSVNPPAAQSVAPASVTTDERKDVVDPATTNMSSSGFPSAKEIIYAEETEMMMNIEVTTRVLRFDEDSPQKSAATEISLSSAAASSPASSTVTMIPDENDISEEAAALVNSLSTPAPFPLMGGGSGEGAVSISMPWRDGSSPQQTVSEQSSSNKAMWENRDEEEEESEGYPESGTYYYNNEEEVEEGEEYESYAEVDDDDDFCDELCRGMKHMTVEEEEVFNPTEELSKKGLPEFKGKHTRFIYTSDGEEEIEEEISCNGCAGESSTLCLKGLPAPAGKHTRFRGQGGDDNNASMIQ